MAIGDLYKDGHSTTDQGVHGKARSKGSSVIKRDVSDAVNFWGLKSEPQCVRLIPQSEDGTFLKWCSQDDHWLQPSEFSPDKRYRDGKYPICKSCRARNERRRAALLREEKLGVMRRK